MATGIERGARAITANLAPVVSAGPDQTIAWPPIAQLAGAVRDDGLPDPPNAISSTWTVLSGPAPVTFKADFSPTTTVTFSVPGTYVLHLTADDGDLSSSDDVVITFVASSSNQPPVVDAGEDRIFNVVGNSFLGGTVIDDGLPNPPGATTALWTQLSGPAAALIADPTQLVTSFTVPVSGTYGFRLTVTDGELTVTDDVVQVADQAAVFDAGPDQTVIFPAPVKLRGTVTDDGLPSPPVIVVSWMVVDGPGAVTFSDPSAAITTGTFEKPGRYVLRFLGGDGAIVSEDDVVVTVLSPNRAPNVDAGPDQTVVFPLPVLLRGTVTDDGLPKPPGRVVTKWSKISGPGLVIFGDDRSPITFALFGTAGRYELELTGADGATSSADRVVVTVERLRR